MYLIRRYDVNGAWTHEEKVVENKPTKDSMWRVYFKIGYEALISFKNYNGTYSSDMYYFKNKERFLSFCNKCNQNHSFRKIIGINKERFIN